MTQITSQIGLDASQALATLGKLTTATNSYANAAGNLGNVLKRSTGGAAAIQKDLTAIRTGVDRLTTSFGLLSRIVFTQAVIKGLRTIQTGLSDATRDAVNFQRQIGLIRTIDDSGASFGQIGEGIRQLSDDLNIGLDQVGSGVFQSISNQVGDFKQSLDFSRVAGQFAKATGSTMADSVDLLSGALKSYGLSVLDADKVSSTFFKTIDLGRVDASTLSNAFGRIGPTASALGVSLEETGAAIATISVRGSNTAETLTQIRGIMSALIKPSDKMKEALAAMGFNSGEAAVKTLGFEGVLRGLAKQTGGSTTALGQLFPNVRALSGELSLSNDEFVGLADAIKETTEAGRNFSKEKFLTAIDSDAERVTKQFNQLKNAATVELGQALLSVGNDALTLLGGADTIVGAIRDHVGAATDSVHALTEALTSNKGAVEKTADSVSALFQGGLAATGIGGILNTLDRKQLDADVLKPLQFRIQINDQQAQAEIARIKDALDQRAAADKETTSKVRKEVSARVAEYEKELKRIEELKKRIPDATDSSIQRQKDAALSNFQRNAPLGITDPTQADSTLNKFEKGLADKRNQQAQAQIDKISFEKMKTDGVDAFRVLEAQGVSTSGNIGKAFAQLQGQIKLAVVTGADQQQVQKLLEDATKINTAIQGDPAAKREFGDALTAAGLAIGKLNDLSLASQVEQSKAIKENLQAAANVQFKQVQGGKALGGLMRALGGRIDYRAMGGRGSDTIPTMLSPGEFVVNATAARRFFPQLQAINAGQSPTYRQDGGGMSNSNNVNIGDINISAPTKPMTANDIATVLNRGLRRGIINVSRYK